MNLETPLSPTHTDPSLRPAAPAPRPVGEWEQSRADAVKKRARWTFVGGAIFYTAQMVIGPTLLAPGHYRALLQLYVPMWLVAVGSALALRRATTRLQVEGTFAIGVVTLIALSGLGRVAPYDLPTVLPQSAMLLGVALLGIQPSWKMAAAIAAGGWASLAVEAAVAHLPAWTPLSTATFAYGLITLFTRERQRLERVEHEGRTRLREANEQLRRSDAARSRLFLNLSHDLRTPLAIIRGEAELLAAHEGAADPAARIGSNVAALTELSDQLLEFARIEAGRTPIRTEPVDAVALAREVAAQLAPQAGAGRIEVRDAGPVVAEVDASHLRRMLVNLVANALRQVRARSGGVIIALRRDGAHAVVEVQDEGPGVPEERQEAIFERFASFDAAGSVASGIGLPLARELAQLNGGSLALVQRAEPTTFRLTLPASDAAPAPRAPIFQSPAPAPWPIEPQALRGQSPLLVVEDNQEMACVIARTFGTEVRIAASLQEARAALEGKRPAAILCDVMLPDGDGYALLAEVRARRALAGVPYIFVSALADPAHRARGILAGADDYLAKPFSTEELRARVVAAMARAEESALALAAQREHFIAELHDGVCASLTRASLVLSRERRDEHAGEDAREILREGLDDARALMAVLDAKRQPWSHVVAEVRREAADACARSGVECSFAIDPADDDPQLTPAEALTLRRAAREALTNVLKHAGARRVHLAARIEGAAAWLVVEDDGRGPAPSADPGAGRGLQILARRVGRLGGRARLEARDGGGARLEARIPLAETGAVTERG